MALSGIIFDFDGTLANTIPICCAAIRAALAPVTGREYSDADIIGLFGPTEDGIIRSIVGDDWHACHEAFLDAYAREHESCVEPFPGLLPILASLHERGVRLAVVTGKGQASAAISLEHIAIRDYFDVIETGSPQGAVKPQAIRRVIARWGSEPGHVAYVGDAPSDMRDARDTGLIALAASWAETADRAALASTAPDALFTSVDSFAHWIETQRAG
jgi:pyrophosphatase PpaX